MIKYYKFRIYPTCEQEKQIQKTFGCYRYVFNHALEQRISAYTKRGNVPTYLEQRKGLDGLKRELPWLKEVDESALNAAVKDVDWLFQKRRNQAADKSKTADDFPRFRRKKHNKSYLTTNTPKITLREESIKLPRVGIVECHVSKEVKGNIASVTILQNHSGKYFVAIKCTDVEIKALPKTGASIGIDFDGNAAICSNGTTYQYNDYLQEFQKRIVRLQRQHSRKTSGSKNQEKARLKLARLFEKAVNQRDDALHKLSSELIKKNDVICIEKLTRQSTNASRNHLYRQLEYKSVWYGKRVVTINPLRQAQHNARAAAGILTEGLRRMA